MGLGEGPPEVPRPTSCGWLGRFKATLWLSEEHPLSLGDQVTPIIDLMAISNAHFAKLRDFITLRLPPGFPVKIGERVVGNQGGLRQLQGVGWMWPQGPGTGGPMATVAQAWLSPHRDSPVPCAQCPHHLQQPVWL